MECLYAGIANITTFMNFLSLFLVFSNCVFSLQWNVLSVILFYCVSFFVFAVTVAVAQQIKNDNRQKKQKAKEEKTHAAVSFAFFSCCQLEFTVHVIYFSSES